MTVMTAVGRRLPSPARPHTRLHTRLHSRPHASASPAHHPMTHPPTMPLLSSASAGRLGRNRRNRRTSPSTAAALALAAALWQTVPARAADDHGHDHGDAPAAAGGSALPRFAATSELFELVGVLDGKTLTLWLDHTDTNAPVAGATLALEFAGRALPLQPRGDGEFEATLPEVPPSGVIPVTATVTTAQDADLLAGELDLHAAGHADDAAAAPTASAAVGLQRMAWVAAGTALAVALVVALVVARVVGRRASARRRGRGGRHGEVTA